MKKKMLLFIALLTIIEKISLSASEPYLKVWYANGNEAIFLLKETPIVNVLEDSLTIKCTSLESKVKSSMVLKFTYGNIIPSNSRNKFPITDEVTNIDQTKLSSYITNDGEKIIINNKSKLQNIRLYNNEGKEIPFNLESSNNTTIVSLSSLSKGLYIIKTEDVTYKFVKR